MFHRRKSAERTAGAEKVKLTERERKFVTVGGIAWGLIIITFLVIIPWQRKRSAENRKLNDNFNQLKEVKALINRRAECRSQEAFLVGGLLNQKEIYPYGRQINEVHIMLQNIAKSKGIKITSVRNVKTAVVREDMGLRKAAIKITATVQDAKKFTEFFVDLDYMPGLLNIEEFSMKRDPRKAKGINFNFTVSTLVREAK